MDSNTNQTPDQRLAQPVVVSSDWFGWLVEKVAQAEKTLKMREDMAATCRSGTQAEWTAAAKSTGTKATTKVERLKEAQGHDRIAVKLRRELEMFRATLAIQRERDAVIKAVDEYIQARAVNIPADRVQNAWDELRRLTLPNQ